MVVSREAQLQGSNYEIRILLGVYCLRLVVKLPARACGILLGVEQMERTKPLYETAGFNHRAPILSNYFWVEIEIGVALREGNRGFTEL